MENIIFKAVAEFLENQYKGEKIIIYGAGRDGRHLFYVLKSYQVNAAYFVDGDAEKQGSLYEGIEVRSPFDILYEDINDTIVLLGLSDSEQPKQFLEENKIRHYKLYSAHNLKKLDMMDPFLGYNRIDDIAGFKIFGDEDPDIKIVALGGSTTDFSYGSHNSWPYYLYKNYAEDGIKCQVYNGGIGGYTSCQELLKLLRDGLALSPDLVVSYSGVNDGAGVSTEQYPLICPYLRNTLSSLEALGKVCFGVRQDTNYVDDWIKNTRLMNAICKEFGIVFHSFLQPYALIGDYILTEREKEVFLKGAESNAEHRENQKHFYASIFSDSKIKEYPYIHDLTTIFKGKSGLYVDLYHVSEEGNKIIADAVYDIIKQENHHK